MTFTKETKTIVIGGTSGIGKAVATALANRDGTIEVASRSTGLDVKDEAAIAAYFDAQGPVDHVVFTAGSSAPGGAVTDVSFDAAKQAFDTKFWGAIAVAKAAARHIKPGGTITLTSGFLARRLCQNCHECGPRSGGQNSGQRAGTNPRQCRQPRADRYRSLRRYDERGAHGDAP